MPFFFNPFTGTFDYYQTGAYAPTVDYFLLMEDGASFLLLETGDKIILE